MATLADCWEDGIDSADDDSDSEIQPRVVIGREGVRISCRHAKGTLHEFASSLTATDEFFTPTPIFFGEKRDESFRATVILPSSVRPPIARWAMSRWHATKGRAIREASARQLEKLAVLPWVTPQFKNMYAVGKADGVNEDLLPPGDLLDLAAHQLTERRGDVAPALVKPTDDNSVMYAYQLRVQWHNAGMEIPERLGNWRELTRKRVAAIEKLRILTPEPLVGRVIEAVKEIPISASGLGRSDSRLGTVKVTLTPEGAVNVTGDFMNTIWAFHRQVFAKVDGGAVVDSWSQCQADRPFYIVSASTGDMVEMARILDAFQDDPRLLVEIGLTVSELARVEASPLSRTLAAVPLHLLFEALTPKQCEMMIDSEKHEPLGCALLEILASEYVWADQFDEGEAALEGKLTEERQAYVLRERVAYRGLMSTVCSAMQWRDQQSSPLPGYQVADGSAQPVLEGAARDRATAFLNALRTSTTSLVGVVFGEAGWRAGIALLRRLELIPEDEVGELVPHSAVGGRAEVDAMGLPQDIPPMVRDYLLRPPVTYDTLLIANGLNVPPIGGYEFRRHPWLLMEAFTHASVAAVSPSYSNERLEWIGDAVLGAVVWSKLYEEGRATLSSFIDYTCNFHLARVAVLKLGAQNRINVLSVALQSAIGRYVRELHHDEQPVPKGPKALADCVEAIIGAIWLDAGGSTGEGWDAAARFIRDNVFSLELAERRPAPRGGPGDDGPPEGRRRRRARRRRIPGLQADDSGGQTPSTSSSTPARTRAHLNRNDQAVFVRDLVARLGNVEELLRQLPGS
ncbi:hypothetical protein Pmar_PMAR007697 [Perkinsus marinus ATCC 50983]|uniref:RNase III domain-containing protein n=1 Tax=Perkinsus marinus (strain ATCC 50983 / TXsc) TaxID=423536 RepID=C5LMW0_PERM5|nr:hypothetical protein Pmar_PMAR007697 [Perkinsus marinus ATCC 50983]EER02001.1 hypothetical protein Pmar_PMAR007697 [Perkinsus marinus ATCC 50983]|eukprot:XP_002769283.1 hypothetical protein Pmar_PMAR007697 [Perkinsus marinus ATCC 50983]